MTEEDIELVRKWRNQEFVRNNLKDNRSISENEQLEWYRKLDKIANRYYIVSYKNEQIGVASLINIDSSRQIATPGFFIGESSYLKHPVAAIGVMGIIWLAFSQLAIRTLHSCVNRKNMNAIYLYRYLGFQQTSSDDEYIYHELQKESCLIIKIINIETPIK